MHPIDSSILEWERMNHILPAVIQHALTGDVLMLGYMDEQALEITQVTQKLTLYSHSKKRIWRKGEESGHSMDITSITPNCNRDSLLIQVIPTGPTCYLGNNSCFQVSAKISFLAWLADIIQLRGENLESLSYTAQLFNAGISRCAQKIGEESTEVIIAAVENQKENVVQEVADLLFHLLILLTACELNLYQVIDCLQHRHMPSPKT